MGGVQDQVELEKASEYTGTVPELNSHMKTIHQAEGERRSNGELPESAPAPIMKRKMYKELGSPTAQAVAQLLL